VKTVAMKTELNHFGQAVEKNKALHLAQASIKMYR